MKITIENSVLRLKVDKKDRIYLHGSAFTPIEIKETKEQYDDEFGSVNFYCNYVGDPTANENVFNLQIRAFQSLTDTTKKRNIIATVRLSDSEIMELAKFVLNTRKKHKTFSRLKNIQEIDKLIEALDKIQKMALGDERDHVSVRQDIHYLALNTILDTKS